MLLEWRITDPTESSRQLCDYLQCNQLYEDLQDLELIVDKQHS